MASGLIKRYGVVTALEDVDLTIPTGAVGLLGPNGAGKSTLLKILAGITLPTAGQIEVLGLDMIAQPLEVKERIGFMPEYDCLNPDYTGVGYLVQMGRISGLTRTDALSRAHEVLGYLKLGEERNRKIRTYSLGMRQKVKLAQALLHNPDLLLLDEPTSGLDPWARNEMLGLLAHVTRTTDKTIIISTHILADVEFLCKHVVVINQGRLVLQGEVAELKGKDLGYVAFRIGGNLPSFVAGLRARGWAVTIAGEEVRIQSTLPKAIDDGILVASQLGIQVRGASIGVRTLEEAFIELLVTHRQGEGAAAADLAPGDRSSPPPGGQLEP